MKIKYANLYTNWNTIQARGFGYTVSRAVLIQVYGIFC